MLSQNPPKGTYDWLPEEFKLRKFIFDTWRNVCEQHGFEEYLTPIIESADIYRAKSGEDIGGKELMTMTDKAGRELAIRPEMTPSVTRMITKVFESEPKPLKYFSIANFLRNEKPQKGRNREFWQLNFDIFGEDSIQAEIEIMQMCIEIMLDLGAPENSFVLGVNSRKVIDVFLEEVLGFEGDVVELVRYLDKYDKLTDEKRNEGFENFGLDSEQIEKIDRFMQTESLEELNTLFESNTEVLAEIEQALEAMEKINLSQFVKFDGGIIRGFDYYDGLIFEMKDLNPENSRSLFGGGRYNGLANIFGKQDISAVGVAPGDETLKIFLETWDLIPAEIYKKPVIYLPYIDESLDFSEILKLAAELRNIGISVDYSYKALKFNKMFKSAEQKGYEYIIIFGTNEQNSNQLILRNIVSGDEIQISLDNLYEIYNFVDFLNG